MNYSKWKIASAIGLVAVLCLAIKVVSIWEHATPRNIVMDVTGIDGTAVELLVETDGKTQTIQETLPATVTFNAHHLAWQVTRLDGADKDQMQVAIHLPSHRDWTRVEGTRELRGGFHWPDWTPPRTNLARAFSLQLRQIARNKRPQIVDLLFF